MKKYLKIRLDAIERVKYNPEWIEYGSEDKEEALELIRKCFIDHELVDGANIYNTYISEDTFNAIFTIGFAKSVLEIAENILATCPVYILVEHKELAYEEYTDRQDIYKIQHGGIYILNSISKRIDTMFISYNEEPEETYIGEFRFYDTNN